MEERGVAPVVGIVLLLGLVLTSGIALFAVGSVALDSMQGDAQVDQAENAMVQYSDSVQNGESTSLSLPDGGQTEVSSDSRIQVEVGGDDVVNETLGSVIYEEDGSQRVFEGGAVFAKSSDHTTVVQSPPINYDTGTPSGKQGDQTLTLDIITVAGSTNNIETGNDFDLSSEESLTNSVVRDTVTVTITSDYADGWASYFEENTAGSVELDGDTVTVEFDVTEPTGVGGGFVADGTSVSLTSDSFFSSYNSNEGERHESENEQADLRSISDVTLTNEGVNIKGDVHVDGLFRINTDNTIHGSTYVNDFQVDNPVTVKQDAHVTNDLSAVNPLSVNNDIYVGSKVTGSSLTVEGDMHVGDNVNLNDNLDVEGSVYVDGDLTVDGSVDIDGNVVVSGDYQSAATETDIGGQLRTAGNASIDGVDIAGSIEEGYSGEVAVVEPTPPQIDPPQKPAQEYIDGARNEIVDDNDNDQVEEIDGNRLDLSEGFTLESGDYNLEELSLSGYNGESELTIDSSDGPVRIFVDGEISMQEFDINVMGDNPVELYTEDDVDMWNSAINTEGDQASMFWMYTSPDSSVTLGGNPAVFTGVMYGISNDGDGTEININNNAEVRGSILGDVGQITNEGAIYYDEALKNQVMKTDYEEGSIIKTYLHVSKRSVSS